MKDAISKIKTFFEDLIYFTKTGTKNAGVILTALLTLLSMFGFTPTPADPGDGCVLLSEQSFYGIEFFARAQGVTTDGSSYYFSSNLSLCKTDLHGNRELINYEAIPAELLVKGCNHIGGISYYDGRIYASIESGNKDVATGNEYEYSYIVSYNADTLKPEGLCKRLPREYQPDGVPWCAVDANRGYLYTSAWNDAQTLNIYRLTDGELLRTVPLSQTVSRVQGAEVYDCMIYMSTDTKADKKEVLSVDPETGEVKTVFTRNVGIDTEAEGMTIRKTVDGVNFYFIDIAPNRLSMKLREYGILGSPVE